MDRAHHNRYVGGQAAMGTRRPDDLLLVESSGRLLRRLGPSVDPVSGGAAGESSV
jgi:hypothetical protein